MFIELRKQGKKKKYYLIHSYREDNKVKRISRYLGSNLNEKQIQKLKNSAEKNILQQIQEQNNPLFFELNKEEIKRYDKYDKKIEISHLEKLNWKLFTEKFTYNTNAIEGSSLELSEVKNILNKKEKPDEADDYEAIGVAEAINYIKETKEKLSLSLIKKMHEICFRKTKAFAGKIRDVEVVIKDSGGNIIHRGTTIKKLNNLINELCRWYEKHKRKYPPLLLASLVHNQFETIHPFQDGNGRVGRLLLNYVLLRNKYPPINIRLKDRQRYYRCLQIYQTKGDILPTIKFLIDQYKKQYG